VSEVEFDPEKDSYASLADEMNDPDAPPWDEEDWDEQAVAEARRYAERHALPWPPGRGDYDRFYEKETNR
jgi:hypothetical protein